MAAYIRRLGGTNNASASSLSITVPTSAVVVGNTVVIGYTVPQEEDSDAGSGDALAAGFKDKPAAGAETATFTYNLTDAIVGYVAYKASAGGFIGPPPIRVVDTAVDRAASW